MDIKDDGSEKNEGDPLTPLNIKKKPKRQVAVALEDSKTGKELPRVAASGRGKIAEQILQLAFENDIKVREDGALAEMLAAIDLDSPIPTEAFMAVAEILAYMYRANGEPDPFNAILEDMRRIAEENEGSAKNRGDQASE